MALRILLIEDNEARKNLFESWLPPRTRLVWARNAGQALGLLARDRGAAYAGIMLDHDLEMQPYTDGEQKTGTDVATAIRTLVSRDTPILVHSMNFDAGDAMAVHLSNEGFRVTRIPMREMDRLAFLAWLDDIREDAE